MYRLIVAIGPDKGRIFNLATGAPLVMGRRNANILLTDHNVSRQQSQFLVREGQWWVVDLRSTNGTFVNGARIAQAHLLKHNDQIRVGRSVLVFQSIAALKRAQQQRPQQPPQTHAAPAPQQPPAQQPPARPQHPRTIDPRAIDDLERHIAARSKQDTEQPAKAAGPKQRPAAPVAEPRRTAGQRTPARPGMPSPKPVPTPAQTKPVEPQPVPPEVAPAQPEVAPAQPEVPPPSPAARGLASPPPEPPPELPPAPPEQQQETPKPQTIDEDAEPSHVEDASAADGVPSPAEPAAPQAVDERAEPMHIGDVAAETEAVSPAESAAPQTSADHADPVRDDDAFAAAQTADPGELEADTAAEQPAPMFGVADDAQPITSTPSVDFEPAAHADDDAGEARPDGVVDSAETDDAAHVPHAFEHDAESAATADKADDQSRPDAGDDAHLAVETAAPQAISDADDDEPLDDADVAETGAASAVVEDHDVDDGAPPTGMHFADNDAPYVAYAEDYRHTAPTENGHGRYDIPSLAEPALAGDDRQQHVRTHEHAMHADAADAHALAAAQTVGEDDDAEAMFETVVVAVAVVDDQPDALGDDRFGLAAWGDEPPLLGADTDEPSDEREYLTDRLLADAAEGGAGAVGHDATASAQAVRADLEDDASVDAFFAMFLDTERTTFPSRPAMAIDELFEAAALTGDHAIVDRTLDVTDVMRAAPPGETEADEDEPLLDAVGPEVDDEIEDELTKPPPKPVDFERIRHHVHDHDHDAGSTSLLYATEQAVEKVEPEVKQRPVAVPPVDETGRPETPHAAAAMEEQPSVDYYAWEERQRRINRTKLLWIGGIVISVMVVTTHLIVVTQWITKKDPIPTYTPVAPRPTPATVDPLGENLPETSEDRMDSVRSSIRNMIEGLPKEEEAESDPGRR